jgi:multidrug efflux pump subunit AcrB
VKIDTFSNLQQIEADTKGRFIPLRIKRPQNTEQIEKATQEFMKDKTDFDFRLEGSIYEHELYTKNIAYILFISVILMYLIMVAQFESFVQPLLILVEIPINTAITLILLPIFGETLNIMSAVGLVVSCGIVINDSILKIDVINDLRKKGLPLKEAIHQAGKKRLRSIIMTALTSVLALLPILLSKDVGAEIQKPFAVTMLITLLTGTFVSLFIIPVFYWFIYKKNDKKNHL